jgi:hypothetical protein
MSRLPQGIEIEKEIYKSDAYMQFNLYEKRIYVMRRRKMP